MTIRFVLALTGAVLLAATAGAAEVCAPKILPPLAGDTESEARAVNAAGEAAGWSRGPAGVRAVFWDAAGKPQRLDPLTGDRAARAYGLNDEGVVVGDSEGATFNAVVWRLDRKPRRLAYLPGHEAGHARGINDDGLIVGWSLDRTDGKGPAGGQALRGVIWQGTRVLRQLPPLAGQLESVALAINAAGEATGYGYGKNGRETALVWDEDGDPTARPPLPSRGSALAHAINADGDLAGASGRAPSTLPTAWGPLPYGLPQPAGVRRSLGLGNDDAGRIVGNGERNGDDHVALYWLASGHVRVLPPLPGDAESEAFDIDDHGFVAGHSVGAKGVRAVLWRVGSACS